MSTSVYVPYNILEALWSDYLAVVSFLSSYTAPGNTVTTAVISAARDTLKNGNDYLSAGLMLNSLSTELANLQQGIALPVPNVDVAMVQTRIDTIQSVINDLTTMLQPTVVPSVNLSNISNGIVGFGSVGILDYIMSFDTEPAPNDSTDFSATLATQSTAWADYATALGVAFPVGEGDAIEAFKRQSFIASNLSQMISGFNYSSDFSIQQNWNWMVAYPSVAMTGLLLSTNPDNSLLQSLNTLRYVIDNTIVQLDTLLASFQEQNIQTVRVVIARANDSLPNIAARELGNYEQWQQIASLNNILPPYTVQAGQQLFMPPASNVNPEAALNYLINYLGVDLYYGPLNQDMLPWNGDFYTISGYNNLEFALLRGIMTTLGTLIYHPNYGSRVPPEVGNIETPQTASHIGAYANSAILYDPRVYKITQWTVSMQPNNQINYNTTIEPNGMGGSSVSLNLVLT